MDTREHLRVFISSPSDVAEERALARSVLERLNTDAVFRNKVSVEGVDWDKPGAKAPLSARLTPQEAINSSLPKPSDCDIVVIILWSRMGTPLPPEFKKNDGSRYDSGTEWEYEDALKAPTTTEILIYRRMEKIFADLGDPQLDQKFEQVKRVKKFFESFENPDGSIRRGYNTYNSPSEFHEQLENHLRAAVNHLVESRVRSSGRQTETRVISQKRTWQGSPFPGLRAFTKEDAPIFFGRGPETDRLVRMFRDPECRLLAVIGSSGSGKSSLVNAGFLPRLEENAIQGSKDWAKVAFTPGEVSQDPFLALAVKLQAVSPRANRTPPRLVAEEIAANPIVLDEVCSEILKPYPEWAELLLFIDQFEELLTIAEPRHRNSFVNSLAFLANEKRIRVVITVRADFISQCSVWPDLMKFFQTGAFHLGPPGPGALYEMITRPAECVGMQFEEGLASRIVEDAGSDPGALALVAYALDELFRLCANQEKIAWKAYQNLGGVHGAMGNKAEVAFSVLDKEAQDTLPQLFNELATMDNKGIPTRRRVLLKNAVMTQAGNRLVNELTKARLLVQSSAQDSQPTVEVAHEALFKVWPRFEVWVNENREFLFWRQRLRTAISEWENTGNDSGALIRGVLLQQALRWERERGNDLDEKERAYIQESFRIAQAQKEAEKLSDVGRVVGDIGHDFKNMIMPISSGVALLEDEIREVFQILHETETSKITSSHEVITEVVDMIRNSTDRMQERLREITDLVIGVSSPLRLAPLKISKVVEEVLKTLAQDAELREVNLACEGLEDLPELPADERRLFNVFYNLVNNAIPEVPKGGSIRISGSTINKGRAVRVSISDTGRGIPPEVRESLFTTQTTSKRAGGTGLGTKIVKDAVDLHGGTITVESEIGMGTTFHIVLPIDWSTIRQPAKEGII